MALNGSVSVEATPNGRDMLVFSWEAVQDSAAMASTVSWKLELVADAYGALDVTDSEIYPWAVTLDGQAFSGNSNIFIGANETVTLATGEAVLAHDADGTKSFEFTFMQDFCGLVWSGETEINEVSGSGTGELDPLTVEETPKKFDIKGFLIGLAMALCSPARQFPQREPVAFLYNGVRLPGLPVVEGYEHATIDKFMLDAYGITQYRLCLHSGVLYGDSGNNVSFATPLHHYVFTPGEDSKWEDNGESQFSNSFSGEFLNSLLWTNVDIVCPDGSFTLATSEPIPVYE